MSFFSYNVLDGALRETVFCERQCDDHHDWSDEYDTHHPCHNCGTTDGTKRWVEYRAVNNRRVRLRTYPEDHNHRKIRRIVSGQPYYEVEDRYGNTGMYTIDQLELV